MYLYMFVCYYVNGQVYMYVCMYIFFGVCASIMCIMYVCTKNFRCVCKFTCMYVCVYVCMYVCMYVYMYVHMDACMYGRVDGLMKG